MPIFSATGHTQEVSFGVIFCRFSNWLQLAKTLSVCIVLQ